MVEHGEKLFQPLNENVNNEHAKRNALRHTKITELVGSGYAEEYEFNELINYLNNIKERSTGQT
jgi:hypothetical protein